MSKEIESVLDAAKREIGDREATGNNDGPQVEVFLASCGLGEGSPWCAAFVNWCLGQGLGITERKECWDTENPAYCPSIHTWARLSGILHTSPQRGDVFLYIEDGWALHTGLVTGYDAATQRFTTIEGNTNPGGSSEGDGVYARSRPSNGCYVFVRWIDLLGAHAAEEAPSFELVRGGTVLATMPVWANRSYIWLGDWAKAFGLSLTWDAVAQAPRLSGNPPGVDWELRHGKAYARVSDLLKAAGVPYSVDLPGRRVLIST